MVKSSNELKTQRDQEAGSTLRAVEARARLYKYTGSYESLDSTEGLHLLLDKVDSILACFPPTILQASQAIVF